MNSEYASESAAPALIAALDLFRAPDRLVLAQSSPLPEGVVVLLRVAGGDQALVDTLAAEHGVAAEQIHEACVFFLQSVLFHQDSDHFRVLGAARDADASLLKSHYRWLQKWLHPDRDPDGWSSVYSHRVNMAWDVLKRPERREEYLESLAPEQRMPGPGTALAISPVIIPADRAPTLRWSAKWVRRLPTVVAALAVLLALGLWSAHRAGQHMLAEGQRRPPAPALAEASSAAPVPVTDATAASASTAESPTAVTQSASEPPVMISSPPAGSPVTLPLSAAAPASSLAVVPSAGSASPSTSSDPALERPRPESASAPAPSAPIAAVDPAPVLPPVPSPAPPRAETTAAATASSLATHRAESPPTVAAPAAVSPRSAPSTTTAAVTNARQTVDSRPEPAAAPPAAVAAAPSPQTAPPPAVAARPQIPAVSVEAPPQSAPERPAPVEARVIAPAPVVATVAVPEAAPVVPVVSAPIVPPAPVTPPGPPPEQVAEGQRLIRSFSTAYRNGELQELVVMFRPNARTPAGNLLDLHGRYQTVFAQSASRSLEFISIDWRETERGLEGVGRFEWAMRPRGGGRVRSAGGEFRIVIEFENGRALIARLDQQDVG